jgi:hypothetical protein
LPLRDTVVRSLLSVPKGFREILSHVVARQREVGDEVLMGVNGLIDHLAARCQVYMSTSRMANFVRELKSNRIVEYDGSVHAIRVLQLSMVHDVLREIDSAGQQPADGEQ